MLLIITSEQKIEQEDKLINQLFESRLQLLHLRKPGLDKIEYKNLLAQIHTRFHSRIMIHEHHSLCNELDLKGVHIQEQHRIDLGDHLADYVHRFQSDGFSVSSSFHEPVDLEKSKLPFNYCLLSPVFSSISKRGYQGRGFEVSHIDQVVVGMGGINSDTLSQAFQLGYKGVGILGAVWNSEDPVQSFQKIYKHFHTIQVQ